MSDEHEAYWNSMVGKPPEKRWYKLVDRFALAYGLTEVVLITEGDETDIILRPVGEPEFTCESEHDPRPEGIPPLPQRVNGYFLDLRSQRP